MAESANQRNSRQFLESLDFDVEVGDRELTAQKVVEDVRVAYSLGFLDPDLIGDQKVLSAYATLTSADLVGVRKRLIVPEQARRSSTWFAQVRRQAKEREIEVLSFSEFLRSFVDKERLEANCRERMKTLQEVTYIEPAIMTRETQSVPIRRFADQYLLGTPGERLIVVHAPGGRGKTMLAEYCARRLFENMNQRGEGPLPFLIKFEDHRGVTRIDALLREALEQYGLDLRLRPQAVELLVRFGVFVLILDGFDELSEKAGERLSLENVRSLAATIRGTTAGRALLTCRTAFLQLSSPVFSTLEREAGEEMGVVELAEFTDEQVADFLMRNAPESVASAAKHRQRTLEFVRREPRISELAKEPLLLKMLSDVVAANPNRLPDNVARVYSDFVDSVCAREIERQGLPATLPQKNFLSRVAAFMIEAGEFAIDKDFFPMIAEEELQEYLDQQGIEPPEVEALLSKLTIHYMFSPAAPPPNLQFRHASYRDHLVAWRLWFSLGRQDGPFASAPLESFGQMFGAVNWSQEVLQFLAEFLEGADAGLTPLQVRAAANPVSPGPHSNRNLAQLLVAWDAGEHFRSVFPPPDSLRGRDLAGVEFEGLDLSGYDWSGTLLSGARFRHCDLTEDDFSKAGYDEMHLEGSTLDGSNFGDRGGNLWFDGRRLEGEELRAALRESGAVGRGVRGGRAKTEPADLATELVREILGKVVEGDRRQNTRLARKRRETFSRGRLCARHSEDVQDWYLPALLDAGYLEESGDRHGTLRASRGRVGEVMDYLFDRRASIQLAQLIEGLTHR